MPFYDVVLSVEESSGVASIVPAKGRSWGLKIRCDSCGEVSSHFIYVDASEVHQIEGGGTHQAAFRCKFCKTGITVDVVPGATGVCHVAAPCEGDAVARLDVRGGEPVELEMDAQWVVESEGGARFPEADLSEDWVEYDEANALSMSLMGVQASFHKSRRK